MSIRLMLCYIVFMCVNKRGAVDRSFSALALLLLLGKIPGFFWNLPCDVCMIQRLQRKCEIDNIKLLAGNGIKIN